MIYLLLQLASVVHSDLIPLLKELSHITEIVINKPYQEYTIPFAKASHPTPLQTFPPSTHNTAVLFRTFESISTTCNFPYSLFDPVFAIYKENDAWPVYLHFASVLFRFAYRIEHRRRNCAPHKGPNQIPHSKDLGMAIAGLLENQVTSSRSTTMLRFKFAEVVSLRKFRLDVSELVSHFVDTPLILFFGSETYDNANHFSSKNTILGEYAKIEQVPRGDETLPFIRLVPRSPVNEGVKDDVLFCGGESYVSTEHWKVNQGPFAQLQSEGDCSVGCAPGCAFDGDYFRPAKPGLFAAEKCVETPCNQAQGGVRQYVKEGMKSEAECFDETNFICLGQQFHWRSDLKTCALVPQGFRGSDCTNDIRPCAVKKAYKTVSSVFNLGSCEEVNRALAEIDIDNRALFDQLLRGNPFVLKLAFVLEPPMVMTRDIVLLGLFPVFFVALVPSQTEFMLRYSSARHGDHASAPFAVELNRVYTVTLVHDGDAVYFGLDGLLGLSSVNRNPGQPLYVGKAEDARLHVGPYLADEEEIQALIRDHGFSDAWVIVSADLPVGIAVFIEVLKASDVPAAFMVDLVAADEAAYVEKFRKRVPVWPFAEAEVETQSRAEHGVRFAAFLLGMAVGTVSWVFGKKLVSRRGYHDRRSSNIQASLCFVSLSTSITKRGFLGCIKKTA